ncbi:hypothetical protein EV714DRAFT_275218 [Schizophyllum commune]
MDSESDGGVSSDSDMEDDSDDADMDSNDSESSDDDSTTGYMYHSDRLQERLAGRMVWRRRIEESDDEDSGDSEDGDSFGGQSLAEERSGFAGMDSRKRSAISQTSHRQHAEEAGPPKRRRLEENYADGPLRYKDQPAPNAVKIPDFGALLLESCKTSHPLHVLDLAPNALASPSSDHIWLASCATAEGLPPVPDDISLGEFVRLVYKKGCRFCDACNIQKIHWAARVRTCKRCFGNRRHFVDEATALDDLKDVRGAWSGSLLKLLPPVIMGKSRKALLSPFYMTLSIDELIDDYARDGVKRMSREGQKKWYCRKRRAMEGVFEEAVAMKEVVMVTKEVVATKEVVSVLDRAAVLPFTHLVSHAKICEQWDKERDESLVIKAEENKRLRKAEIHRRLADMGYGNLLQEPGALDALGKHASVDKAQALTEGAWTHMKGNLVRFLQDYRAAGKDHLGRTDKEKEVYDLSAARKRRRRSRAGY